MSILPGKFHGCTVQTTSRALAAAAAGDVYTMGSNQHGQLGHGHTQLSSRPELVEAITQMVVHVAAGSQHSLALMQTASAGQAQDEAEQRGQPPGHSEAASRGPFSDTAVDSPLPSVPVLPTRDPHSGVSRQPAAAQMHHAAVTAAAASAGTTGGHPLPSNISCPSPEGLQPPSGCSQQLLAWGFNGFGQLGLGDTADRLLPCPVDVGVGLAGQQGAQWSGTGLQQGPQGCGVEGGAMRVVQVEGGWWHTVALLEVE